jgi:hypothetical protein
MPDIFESSKQKFAWAEKRFGDLQREIENFGQLHPYKEVTEPHPDKVGYEVRKIILTKPLPLDIAHITAEVVGSLRGTLDNAGYSIAVASGKINPKSTAFPFAGSAEGMAKAIKGRCGDIPPQFHSLFCGFQPYPGGNDFLWALNEVCNTEKHKIVIPMGNGAYPMGAYARGPRFFSIPTPHVWDSAKNEMVLITLGPGTDFNYQFNFLFFVAFGEVKFVERKEVIKVLHRMGGIVQSLLVAMEAEARRTKLIS